MKLVTFHKNDIQSRNGRHKGKCGALLSTGEILDFSLSRTGPSMASWIPGSVLEILETGDEGLDYIRRVVAEAESAPKSEQDRLRECGAIVPAASTQLLPPVPRPALVLATGMNYGQHLKEMGSQIPPYPYAFIKCTTSIIGPGAPIILPARSPDMVDFEGEFSVIFGRPCQNVDTQDALRYIAGYTIANDVSARNWVAGAHAAKKPMEAVRTWSLNIMGKQFPTFCPIGPALVTRDEIADPHQLNLTTTLNGEVMQSANTSDLIFQIPELISYFSKWYRFLPGDIITTGSPAGVGFARDPKVFMKDGDIVSITVEGLGELSNPIVSGH